MTSAQHRPPIPAPAEYGITRSTDVPLYWCRYGPTGRQPLVVLHGGPGAHHDYLLPQMLALAEENGHTAFSFTTSGAVAARSHRTVHQACGRPRFTILPRSTPSSGWTARAS